MSASIEHRRIGDTRKVVEVLKSGAYDLCKDGRFVILKRKATVERTDRWSYALVGGKAYWKTVSYDHGSIRILPTWWERLRAFIARREPPLPRAVVLVDDGKATAKERQS